MSGSTRQSLVTGPRRAAAPGGSTGSRSETLSRCRTRGRSQGALATEVRPSRHLEQRGTARRRRDAPLASGLVAVRGGTLKTSIGLPVGSAPVTLQPRPLATHNWANVSRAKTNSYGIVQSRVNPRRTSDSRWVFRGDRGHVGARHTAVRVHPGQQSRAGPSSGGRIHGTECPPLHESDSVTAGTADQRRVSCWE